MKNTTTTTTTTHLTSPLPKLNGLETTITENKDVSQCSNHKKINASDVDYCIVCNSWVIPSVDIFYVLEARKNWINC